MNFPVKSQNKEADLEAAGGIGSSVIYYALFFRELSREGRSNQEEKCICYLQR